VDPNRFRTRCAVGVLASLASLCGCAGLAGPARYDALDHQLGALEVASPAADEVNPSFGAQALERGALVAEVLRRNPGVAAARAAWRAALARYPQETALDDPLLAYSLAPRSVGSHQVDTSQRVEVSQALPFPGKLALRGAVALGEAEAAARDYEAVRLRLAAMASTLYDDWWLAARSLDITRRHLELVRELRPIAVASYESGAATPQEPLRAEIEEADLLHQEVELETERSVAAQQLALLLHMRDGAALPPPPPDFTPLEIEEGNIATRVEEARAARPELRAADARVASRQAATDLARREFLPDFRLVGGYDTFWDASDQRPSVGIEMNVPLQLAKRRAALDEARARLGEVEQERARTEDEVESQVRTALVRLHEARHLLGIARDRMLPAARDRLSAARASFEAGRAEFRDLIDAERELRSAELDEQRALAEMSRRGAALAAAIGIVPGLDTGGGTP
jgi:outer membrane protein, heavy metal efflux system